MAHFTVVCLPAVKVALWCPCPARDSPMPLCPLLPVAAGIRLAACVGLAVGLVGIEFPSNGDFVFQPVFKGIAVRKNGQE